MHFSADRALWHCQAVQTLSGSSGTSQQIGHSGTVRQFRHCLAVQALLSRSGTVRQFRHCRALSGTVGYCRALKQQIRHSGVVRHLNTAQHFLRHSSSSCSPNRACTTGYSGTVDTRIRTKASRLQVFRHCRHEDSNQGLPTSSAWAD